MIRSRRRIALCTGLIVLNLAIIWGNSLLPGTESSDMSGSVLAFIMELLDLPASAADMLHTLIRKAAHFTEFACLGCLLTWRFGMAGEKRCHLAALPVLCAMAAALTDETIQMFTPDRGPSLMDVWIDTCGAAAGMMVLLCGYHLIKRIENNNTVLEETT